MTDNRELEVAFAKRGIKKNVVAKELGISGAELFKILNSSGLLHSYIIPSYEALHTQSKQYIVNEIISVLKERNLVA